MHPTIVETLEAAGRRRVLDALDKVEFELRDGIDASQIANGRYACCRWQVADTFEACWRHAVEEPFFWVGRYQERHPEIVAISDGSLEFHRLPSIRRRLDAVGEDARRDPCWAAMDSVVAAFGGLHDLVTEAKAVVVKGRPRSSQEARPAFTPPPAAADACNQVRSVLMSITRESRVELQEKWTDYLTTAAKAFEEYQRREEQVVHQGFAVHRFLRNDGRLYAKFFMTQEVLQEQHVCQLTVGGQAFTAMLDRRVDGCLDEIQDGFVAKNLAKLASIIGAKTERGATMRSVDVLGHTVDLAHMSGTIRISFSDGSGFSVQNQTVFVVNRHGTRFLRYPITFHDVQLPDGSMMSRPSEKRMHEVFVPAEVPTESPEPGTVQEDHPDATPGEPQP